MCILLGQSRFLGTHLPSWVWFRVWFTPWKFVFDITSIGQRLSPWPCNSVEVEMKFHLECKLHFPCAQLMLRQTHFTNVPESIEAKYWVSWLSFDIKQAWRWAIKTALNSSFCGVTADSKSMWPHGKKVYFRGVGLVALGLAIGLSWVRVMWLKGVVGGYAAGT